MINMALMALVGRTGLAGAHEPEEAQTSASDFLMPFYLFCSSLTMSDTMRPPQLVFDDGSRVMQEETTNKVESSIKPVQISVPVKEYYEIDRLVKEMQQLPRHDRVALQFPDELLHDAPEVCWEFEQALPESLVFCLGDTTFAPCCPDQVAAAHLNADCLIHYGHACLSPCNQIPVLYSFSQATMNAEMCVDQVLVEAKRQSVKRILLLYELKYHLQATEALQTQLSERGDIFVVAGQIPELAEASGHSSCGRPDCCQESPPATQSGGDDRKLPSVAVNEHAPEQDLASPEDFVVGGLELPKDMDWSTFTLLYIGDDQSRQYLNIVLRFLSGKGPTNYWTWNPNENHLSTELSSSFQRQLNRRFYLIQKARHLSVFGILVANLSDTYMRCVVASLRHLIQEHGRVSYTFVVGKINPAKLANFAEIECFVLVACPEHSLLQDEREFPVPVLTPLELSMAFGVAEWGTTQYSLDVKDYLKEASATMIGGPVESGEKEDTPYFSLVTGRYESAPVKDEEVNLAALPGQGKLTTYTSAASDFLKQRDYQGLEVQAGSTEVRKAVQGQQGIASNYGER